MRPLTALNLLPAPPACATFGGMQAHSQSTDSPSAITTTSLQDGVLPIPTAITNCPNLAVVKTDNKATVAPGGSNSYTVTVTNNSPAIITSAPVSESLPSGFTLSDWTCAITTDGSTIGTDACGAPSSGTSLGVGGQMTTVTLEPGGVATFTVTGTVSRTATGTLTNGVTIDDGTQDPGTDDRSSDTTAIATPKLGITKTAVDCATGAPVTAVDARASVCFDIVVTNTDDGTDPPEGPALDLTITDTLPTDAGLQWSVVGGYPTATGGSVWDGATSTAGPPVCAIAGGVLTCDGGAGEFDLGVAGSVTIRLTSPTTGATVPDAPVVNSATAAASNSAPVTDDAQVGFLAPALTIVKTAVDCGSGVALTEPPTPPQVDATSDICFAITVGNTGPGTALDVELSDPLPGAAGLDWTIESASGTRTLNGAAGPFAPAACTISGTAPSQSLTCGASVLSPSTFDLAKDQSFTVVLRSPTTNATVPLAPVTNTATADASNTTEVTDSAQVAFAPTTLEVTKTAVDCDDTITGVASIDAEAPVCFRIRTENTGTHPAVDVVLSDNLPTLQGLDWDIVAGSVAGDGDSIDSTGPVTSPDVPPVCAITGAIGAEVLTCGDGLATSAIDYNLAPGDYIEVVVTSPTTAATLLVDPISNTAAAKGTNTAQVTASDSVTIRDATLSIAKDAVECPTGDSNTGPADANVGEDICFSITVSNIDDPANPDDGGTAIDTRLTDTMPADAGLNWSVESVTSGGGASDPSCAMTGAAGAQGLTCGDEVPAPPVDYDLPVGGSFTVVVSSPTDASTVITSPVDNTAQADATNAPAVQDSASIRLLAPVLAISKVADASPVDAGTAIGYTITVANPGPGTAYDTVMTDSLPIRPGVTWSISSGSPTATGGTPAAAAPPCSIVDDILTCGGNGYDLPPGGTFSVHIESPTTAGSASPADMVNNALVDASNTDPPQAASDKILVQGLDLSITKSDGTGQYIPGEDLTYTIDVLNAGPATATNASVQDTVPAQITGVTWTCASLAGGTCDTAGGSGNTINLTVDLAAGQSVRLTVTGTVDSATTVNPLSNTATVTPDPSGPPDVNPDNNTATDNDSPDPVADLTIVKDGPSIATPGGDDLVFTIEVGNNGPSVATDVTVTDPTPAGLTFESVTGCLTATTFPCDVGDLAVGQTQQLTVTYSIPADYETDGHPMPIDNVASVSAPEDPDGATDNHVVPVEPVANVLIEKAGPAQAVRGGDALVYTITVTNEGPSDAQAVVVSDPDPPGLVFVSNSGACATTYPCDLGTLAAGETVEITSTYTIPSGYIADGNPLVIHNDATVTSETDPEPPPPAAWDVPVEPMADVEIVKTGVAEAAAGETVPYTLVVTNNGPSDAEMVSVKDPDPVGLALVSIEGCLTATAFPCDLGTVEAGGTRTVTAMYTIAPEYMDQQLPNPITNIAAVESPSDPTPFEPVSWRVPITTLATADLSITKTDGTDEYVPGGELTYTLEVSNAGPVPVTGATVTDDVPATLGDVTWTCTGVGAAVCGSASGSGDVSVGVDIPVDGSVVVTVTGTVASDATDPIVNTATVTPPDTISDPTPENNSATDTDAPGIADLELVKAVEGESFLTGEPVTYTIDVTNYGPAVATAPVTVTDPLPESVTFDSASGQGWSCAADAGTVVCTFDGDLAVDDSTSFQIVGILTAEPSEAVVNTATVSAGNAEATLSNNESSAELIVDPVEVEPVVIQAPPPPPAPTPPQPQVLARVQPQTVLVRTGTSVALYLGGATLLVLCGLWVRRVGRRRPSE